MLRLPAIPLSLLLASLGLVASLAQAQPLESPRGEEREVVLTDTPEESPVVYGTPDVPLVLRFDRPFREDAGVVVTGADVRAHPVLGNTLVLTPSKPLDGQGSVPVSVPLADGVVALSLVVTTPEKSDGRVRVVRRAAFTEMVAPKSVRHEDFQEALRVAAGAVLGGRGTCLPSHPLVPQSQRVKQRSDLKNAVLVCLVGSFSYLRVAIANPDCRPTTARLARGQETVEVLFFEPAFSCSAGTCQMLVVRAPPDEAGDFLLELANDNVSCASFQDVKLTPGGR